MLKRYFFLFILAVFVFVPRLVAAAGATGIVVAPAVIEDEAKLRDILEYKIKVKNIDKPYRATIYPVIRDVYVDGSQTKASSSDPRETSLSLWMSIPRGVIMLYPGEEYEAPLTIKIEPYVKPGKYHVILYFSEAPDGYAAEANILTSAQPQVLISINVVENIVEKAQLVKFLPAKDVFTEQPATFDLEIKNIGNRDVMPKGYIYVYNRQGQEVDKIDVNSDEIAVAPEASVKYEKKWSKDNALGRYKAKLELEYGGATKRDLQDSFYFWVLPWPAIILFAGAALILIILLLISMKMKARSYQLEELIPENAVAPLESDEDEIKHEVIDLRR